MSHLADPEFYKDPFGGSGMLVTNAPDRRVWIRPHPEQEGVWEQCVVQPVDQIFEANRELYNNASTKWGDMSLVAAIPNSLYWHGDFAKAREARDEAWMKKFLNDPDNRKLRTKPGNL